MYLREISEFKEFLIDSNDVQAIVQGEGGSYALYLRAQKDDAVYVVGLALSTKNKKRENAGGLREFKTIDAAVNVLRQNLYCSDVCVRYAPFDSSVQ